MGNGSSHLLYMSVDLGSNLVNTLVKMTGNTSKNFHGLEFCIDGYDLF